MATFSSSSLLLLLFLLFAGVAHARPCKTILLSYYSFSSSSSDAGADHAFLPFPGAVPRNPSQVFVFSELRRVGPRLPGLSVPPAHPAARPAAGRGPDAFSLALTLILGVACGGLAAATVYLVWVVVGAPGAHYFEDEDEEELAVKAAGGYVKVPAAPVKEGYEVNN